MNNNDYIDVEYEKTDKKTKSNKFCKVGVICLLIFTLMWFLSSLFINITKLNSFDTEEEIKTELVDKTLNKSRVIDKSLASGIRQDGSILLSYELANIRAYYNSNITDILCELSLDYDLVTNNYSPYMRIHFYLYDHATDLEIDELYDITSQYLTDSSMSYMQFVFTLYMDNGLISVADTTFFTSNGDYFKELIPSTYPDLRVSYLETFDISSSLPISSIINEVQYLESISNSRYNIGYNNGLAEGEVIGYDNGYDIGYNSGVNNGFADNAFKKLFNVIMNAPFNIFSGLLNFEIFGVNLFALFSFVFTTMIIFAIVKIFLK